MSLFESTIEMTAEQIVAYIQGMEAKIKDYQAWNEARAMVIDYLKEHHELTDQYQWAYRTIELLEELRKIKAATQQETTPQRQQL